MSLIRPLLRSPMSQNLVRYSLLSQPRHVNIFRQLATKIEPKKKSSMKTFLIGVSKIFFPDLL